jgi:hypothetical protein
MSTATKVRERPILFSGEMVRAILDGRKSMTRRLRWLEFVNESPNDWAFDGFMDGDSSVAMFHTRDRQHAIQLRCPYGGPGDVLWVRETWQLGTGDGENMGINVQVKTEPWCVEVQPEHREAAVAMAKRIGCGGKWRPSIHMPRWACRLTLELTEVRVERVQDISEADAKAECCDGKCPIGSIPAHKKSPCVYHFAQLWEAINGKGAWDRNDWCWVLGFKRVEATNA